MEELLTEHLPSFQICFNWEILIPQLAIKENPREKSLTTSTLKPRLQVRQACSFFSIVSVCVTRSSIPPCHSPLGGPMYGTVLTSNQSTNPQGTQQIDYGEWGAQRVDSKKG